MRNRMKNMEKTSVILAVFMALFFAGAAMAENPYANPDNTWISLSGTVVSASDDGFYLDYGEGVINVEMDKWDWYQNNFSVLEGDRVTVYGEVDKDLFEGTELKANSVYAEGLNSYIFADEGYTVPWVTYPIVYSQTILQGRVTKTNPEEREFIIDSGTNRVRVETDDMFYNPLDDKGFQRVEPGDVVRVSGDMDNDLFEGRELEAESVITLHKRKNDKTSLNKK